MVNDTILLLDAGNSRIKWGIARSGEIRVGAAISTQEPLSGELFERCWANMEKPSQIVLASVANIKVEEALSAWVLQHWQLDIRRVTTCKKAAGVINGYENPEQLGVDRWLALLASRHLTQSGPVCVVDCGTAITLDMLDADGKHQGGVIIPGLNMMKQALATGTERLTLFGHADSQRLGTCTAAAIASGVLGAVAGLIEHFMQKYGSNSTLLLTGGDAPRVAAALNLAHRLEPDLVLQGLLIAATLAE